MNDQFQTGRRIAAEVHQFSFDAEAAPAMIVDSGDIVTIETLDCFSNRIVAPVAGLRDDADVLAHIGGRYNPVSQPIHVRGAEPGDALAVDIIKIELGRRQPLAVTHVAHDWATRFGGEGFADVVAPATLVARIEGNDIVLPLAGRLLRYAARPMIGTIGTAPAGAAESSLFYGPSHGGNLDCPMVREGARVLLPVNVEGGLLSLGDIHALMGDGEITGTALETSADVTIRVSLLKRSVPLSNPRLVDKDGYGAIGCGSNTSLQANIADAVHDLVRLLGEEFGIAPADALQLVNLFAVITVNQAVVTGASGWSSVLVRIRQLDLAPFLPCATDR